ncbi:MAG: alpha/beta hydrolase-fold protein, partial [Bacteroidota bacterium]
SLHSPAGPPEIRSPDAQTAVPFAFPHHQMHWRPAIPPRPAPLSDQAPELVLSAHKTGFVGRLERYEDLASEHVRPRTVEVWLPPEYDLFPSRRYPVVYLQDGQNLFDPYRSYSGVDWGVDETLHRETRTGGLPAMIAVGIYNSPERIPEYMPEKPFARRRSLTTKAAFVSRHGGEPRSDAYLRFLVEELKPFVDTRYRTKPDAEHSAVVGSSMGGLISLYAFTEYPDVFRRAGCLSTSWTVAGPTLQTYLKRHLPDPAGRRLYFDYGIESRYARYKTLQLEAAAIAEHAGYAPGRTLKVEHYPGAGHSESAWRARFGDAMRFVWS